MASGHYENRIVQRINPETGQRYNVTIRVWVADPVQPKPATASTSASRANAEAARRRRIAQQKKAAAAAAARKRAAQSALIRKRESALRAQRIAARKAYEQRLAEARRAAYEALRERQYDLTRRAGVIRDDIKQKSPAPKAPTLAVTKTTPLRDDRRQAIVEQQADQKAYEAQRQQRAVAQTRERWTIYQNAQKRAAVLNGAKAGDPKSARGIEAEMARERDAVLKNGTGDTKALELLSQKYDEHADAVYSQYESLVAKINAALEKGDTKTARSLYYSPAFVAYQNEFKHLFGKGDNPLKDGAYAEFHKQKQEIALAQRDWWKRQMKASLNSRLIELQRKQKRTGEDFSKEIKSLQNQIGAFTGSKVGKVIDHYETWIGSDGKEHMRPVYRDRTTEEELDAQRAKIIMEQERLSAQRAVAEKRAKALDMAEGMTRINGKMVSRRDAPIIRAAQAVWGDKMPDLKRPQDVQQAADTLVNRWVDQNPRPPGTEAGEPTPEEIAALQRWARSKEDYERSVYAFFGSQVPGALDRFISAPGISHGMAILQGGSSAIGAGARVVAKLTTGSSQISLGVNPSDIPKHVRDMAAKQGSANITGRYGTGQLTPQQKYIQNWLASPEGQAWLKQYHADRKATVEQQDRDFVEGFYGQDDAGARLDALNQYGSRPTSNEGINLLGSLLLDPFNAIPLNFTTYLARGKYAFEAAEKAKGLTAPTAKFSAGLKGFLAVDQGTLELRKAVKTVKKELEKQGLSVERAVDMLNERLVGVADKAARKTVFDDWMRAIGLDPKKVDAAQLFNTAEFLATKKAKDSGIKLLTQADEFNAATKKAIAEQEAAVAKVADTTKRESGKMARSTQRRVDEGKAAQERLGIQRTEQEEALRHKAARAQSAEAVAAPQVRVKPAEPANNPNISGPSDNHVAARQHKAVVAKVRSKPIRHRDYDVTDEFYRTDAVGNRVPVTFRPDKNYLALVKAAKKGDGDAREQLVNRARYERNRYRMEQEDLRGSPGIRKRDISFQPTKFDLAERAGTVSDEVATARLLADRKTIRQLKRVVGAGEKADDWAKRFVRRHRTKDNRHPLVGAEDTFETSLLDEYGDLRSQVVANRVAIGDDIVQARENSLRGVKDLYETFSHDASIHYPGLGKLDATKLTAYQFKRIVASLTMSDEIGSAMFRDGGQLLFEIFHQLRLAREWDKLREFSDFMGVVVAERPESIWGWMWKTMEERSVLPYSMHINDIRGGFYHAAEAFNLHPELAFSTIPSGYYAGRFPLTFGLTARLQGLAEKASDLFHTAPKGYTKEQAKAEVTRLMHGQAGEPTRVLHYVSERYGDFVKGGEIMVRMRDEMIHALNLTLDEDVLIELVSRRLNLIPQDLVELAERRGVPVGEFLRRQLVDAKGPDRPLPGSRARTLGPRRPLRPEYKDFRASIEAAYWAGEVPYLSGQAHTMMMLARLQTDPDAMVGTLRTYMTYMTKLGGEDLAYGKRLVRDLFEGEIATDLTRATAETLGATRYTDAITGESIKHVDRSRAALWREFGIGPDEASTLAYAKRRASKAEALDKEFAQQAERDTWLSADAAPPMDKYTGSINTLDFTANVEQGVRDMRAGVKGADKRLEGTIRNFMERTLDDAAGNFPQSTLDEIKMAMDDVKSTPEGVRIVARLQEELGTVRVRETLKARRRSVENERAGRHELPPKREPKDDGVIPNREDDARFEEVFETPTPAESAPRSVAEQMYESIFKMSEQEWWAWEKQRANRVLTSKMASAERKKAARQRIKDIDAAEFVVKLEKKRGTYVPWRHRANFRDRVLKAHGKTVEDMIAPKMIAPLVLKASDGVVEQGRTYWRLLKSAAEGPVPSKVKGIAKDGKTLDHIPKEVFDDIEQRVSDAIAEYRGFRADTRTRGRRQGKNEESQRPLGRLSDNEEGLIKVKQRTLAEFAKATGYNISIEAYDEARKVLWKGYVQNRTASWLLSRATKIADRTGADLKRTFLDLRAKEAKIEARRQLGALAFKELYGHSPQSILDEFMRRYTDDATLRHFTPELTPFQRRTLEEHIKHLSGLDALDERMGTFLQSANRPPLSSRELTREYLKDIGAWSPRTTEDFAQGARSWSIWDEAEYWKTNYGEVPEWTDPKALASEFNAIFHDQDLYFQQMKAWGIFSRSQEMKLRLDGHTAQEIEKAALEGDTTLGIKARRELEAQRKYVIERYGSLVSKDGTSLDTMPWLMHPDEYRDYLARTPAKNLPEGMVQNAEELDEMTAMIEKAMEPIWEKYITPKYVAGEQITYHDMFRVASEVQAQMLANPKWARRHRDLIGTGVNRWAWFNRWLIFSNPSFLVTNAIDAPVKTAYYRFTRRGLFNPELARADPALRARAERLTPEMLGEDATTAMYKVKQMSGVQRVLTPRGLTPMERAADRALGALDATGEWAPAIAGRIELKAKMSLAQGMYPQVFTEFKKALGNDELADAAAKNFIKERINRMWPTAGHGPLERLWNRLVPFASYSVRNKVLFISEAVNHPVLINYVNRIGDYIEEENLKQWEKDNPGTEMPENKRRQISLPWAPDQYLDLSTFSDAARGLKPLFDASVPKTVGDQIASWVRVVNPGVQAGIYAMFNAFGIDRKQQWVAVMKNGFPTGEYRLVDVPWLEPWSKDVPDIGSVFWFADAIQSANELGVGGWTAGEVSQMVGQALFFNGITTYDQGAVYASFYFNLKAKDPKAAARWLLETRQGQMAQDWLESKATQPKDFMNTLHNIEIAGKDTAQWFHAQDEAVQERIREGRDKISDIRDAYAAELALLTPGTAAYREMKARMYMAINNVYLNTPELLMANVFGKTSAEWSQQLEDWQTDKLMDTFMAMTGQRPQRGDYDSMRDYNKAVAAWNTQKQVFLQQYPQVAQRLNAGRTELDRLRDQVQKEWDTILGRIAKRGEAIEEAQKILDAAGRDSTAGRQAQDRLDALYLANDLDYSLLERDQAASYFDESDFKTLPPGVLGPAQLKSGLIARSTVLLDFDRVRYEKALREGTLDDFLAQQKYGADMKAAISYAKGGDPFGEFDGKKFYQYMQAHPNLRERYFAKNPAKETEWTRSAAYVEGMRAAINFAKRGGGFDAAAFVQYMKSHPDLLKQYFARHPGKEAQWAQNEAYIRNISVWGKLVGAGRWDEANAAWDRLPQWVKDRYLAKHPEKKGRAIKTTEYLGYMSTWVKMFDKGDRNAAMKYFQSLPSWVKERYYQKHPENRAKFELQAEMSVKLQNYFASSKEDQAKYLAANPDLQKWLAKNATQGAQDRNAILAAYRSIPSGEAWLRRVFREKYPEIFSQEAAGERRLRKVYDTLAEHPDVLPEFEAWVKAIWDTYAEMLKHGNRPLSSYITSERRVPERDFNQSLSAADASR